VSIARKAVKSGTWFAAFRFITQAFSWIVTLVVARILSPNDYGLMAIASILTGYVEVFSELGLGAAIIQRNNVTQKELSSNFWFSLALGGLFAMISFILSYPTSWIFREPRVLPITQLISVLFLIGAFMIVPYNILEREVRFKAIGLINFLAVTVSSSAMLLMAYKGFGVWTLINGTIIYRTVTVILVFIISKWKPSVHFQWTEVRSYLSFGLNVAGSRSLFYLFQKIDKFIVGQLLGTQSLGYYSFALHLASIPTSRIVSLVNQVLFPVFSRIQDDHHKSQDLYLRATKYIAVFVLPMFLSGAVWGDEIIRTFLGDKWIPIIFLFKIFCLTYIFISFASINTIVHNSEGHARWVLYYQIINIFFMSPPIYIAAHYGINALTIPWIVVYPMLCIGWTWFTLRKINIGLSRYVLTLAKPILASAMIILGIKWIEHIIIKKPFLGEMSYKSLLFQEVLMGVVLYGIYLFVMEKKTLVEMWNVRKA
jgi:O-antigen/teichoic acid export membrane protein